LILETHTTDTTIFWRKQLGEKGQMGVKVKNYPLNLNFAKKTHTTDTTIFWRKQLGEVG